MNGSAASTKKTGIGSVWGSFCYTQGIVNETIWRPEIAGEN
jgi:hypothetical protein